VIHTATSTVVKTVPAGNYPTGVAVTPDGTHAYVVSLGIPLGGPGALSVIATATDTVVATVGVGNLPFGVAVSADGTHAYVTANITFGPSQVSVIATGTNTVVKTIPVGYPYGVAVNKFRVARPSTGACLYLVGDGTRFAASAARSCSIWVSTGLGGRLSLPRTSRD
jgi:YVTN family beta-propeller protein